MKARDIMVSPVHTVKPDTLVKEVAKLFMERQISGVPVVDDQGKLVGIISEGDLLHRAEIGTGRRRSWWLSLLANDQVGAIDYIKEHAKYVKDVMTGNVITAAPDTRLDIIAALLEKNAIKRVPIVQDGRLVGLVSRANLIQALATSGGKLDIAPSDTMIRDKLLAHLNAQSWAHTWLVNVTVKDGVVDLWGLVSSDSEKKAIRIAAESMPGVRAVNDNLKVRGPGSMQ
jgi:CBS domain-containing protein